jgi:hypothetical protein
MRELMKHLPEIKLSSKVVMEIDKEVKNAILKAGNAKNDAIECEECAYGYCQLCKIYGSHKKEDCKCYPQEKKDGLIKLNYKD